MKNQKLLILSSSIVAILTLAGCGGGGGSTSSQSSSESTSSSESESSSESSSSSSEKDNGDYDLVYRSWDTGTEKQNNPERQLVKAFEDANNVKIKIVDNVGSGDDYWINIRASVTKGTAADVYMTPNLDYPLAEEYALDISKYANADTEWASIPSGIETAVHFKSGIYAMPCRLNMAGLFANMDIASDVNKDSINYDSSFDDVMSLLTEVKKHQEYIGLNYVDNLYEVLPSVHKKDYGYFTWDGSAYHLDSTEFSTSVSEAKNIYDSKMSFDSLSQTEIAKVGNGSLDSDSPIISAWDKGYMALRYGFTYEIPDMISKNPQFSIKFLGMPGGRNTIIGDYYCVFKNSKNPELAYKFAKWMSFGKEGMSKRFDLYKAYKGGGYVSNTLPLTTDETVMNKYFELFPDTYSDATSGVVVEGIRDVYGTLNEGMVEGVKVVPSYVQSRWKLNTGLSVTIPNPSEPSNPIVYTNCNIGQYLDGCVKGNGNLNQYATTLNEKANGAYTTWMTTNGSKYN